MRQIGRDDLRVLLGTGALPGPHDDARGKADRADAGLPFEGSRAIAEAT